MAQREQTRSRDKQRTNAVAKAVLGRSLSVFGDSVPSDHRTLSEVRNTSQFSPHQIDFLRVLKEGLFRSQFHVLSEFAEVIHVEST